MTLVTPRLVHRRRHHPDLFRAGAVFRQARGEEHVRVLRLGPRRPWWLAGLSMVATTFSSDTPNWVTQQVRQYGVAGNWQWWAMVLTGVATVFFFARLWRRSGVMTDLEFYELRYSGTAASVVRGFRAVYLGLFFNCFIMAMVTLAACKIANILFGLPQWQTILICGVLNVVFAAHAGLWGVLVIDMVQFFIKMTAVIAAAYFSLKEVARHTGVGDSAVAGLHKLVEILGPQQVTFDRQAGAVPHRRHRPADPRRHAELRHERAGADDLHRPDRDRLVGELVSRARNRAAAATSRSACWRRSRKRTRSAARSSSTWRTTCCGRGRGF